METKNNGGSAFPTQESSEYNGHRSQYAEPGMSLRDYFAAKVMAKVMPDTVSPLSYEEHIKNAAEWSYKMAGAMIKARER